MNISFSPISKLDAQKIVRWRYEPPYDIYNLSDTQEVIDYALDPQNNFWGMKCSDELVGFCSFGVDGQVSGGDYSADALDIGMGIRPDLTGHGRGDQFATAAIEFAQKNFSPLRFRVTIAKFNLRAQRVWKKIGFQPIQTFTNPINQREFIVMIKPMNERAYQPIN